MSSKSSGVMGLDLSNSVVEGGSSADGKGESTGGIEDLIFSIFLKKIFKNLSQSAAEVVGTAAW